MRARLLSLSLVFAGLFASVHSHAEDASSHQWQRPDGAAGATLSVSGPRGSRHFTFTASQSVVVNPSMLGGDGVYHWQLTFAPAIPEALQALAAQRRAAGDTSPVPGWPTSIPASSGLLSVQGGLFVPTEPALVDDPGPGNVGDPGEVPNDQVIADDLIVQGSACTGLDCVNNENFGFDTIRLKENNTRITFTDTSVGTFPTNDWTLVANDSANGGSAAFLPALWRLLPTCDGRDAVFYGHAKGVTRPHDPAVRQWRDRLYFHNLSDTDRVQQALAKEYCSCYGAFKLVGRYAPLQRALWHYAGAFFWFRVGAIRSLPWDQLPPGYYGVEQWLSCLLPAYRAVCDYGEQPAHWNFYQYGPQDWANLDALSACGPPDFQTTGTRIPACIT